MLKSRRSNRELERYVAILRGDLGETLAESFAVRYLGGRAEEDYPGVVEGLKGKFLSFMTEGEFAELKRRIEAESGGGEPAERGIDAAD